jgi:hypothetical protein
MDANKALIFEQELTELTEQLRFKTPWPNSQEFGRSGILANSAKASKLAVILSGADRSEESRLKYVDSSVAEPPSE